MAVSNVASSDAFAMLLRRWAINCRRSQIANYDGASFYRRLNYLLGIPTVGLSAVVGTSVFAALGEPDVSEGWQIFVGIVSVLAAVLAALQTFLDYGDLSSKCRAAAADYGAVKREIDQILAGHAKGAAITDELVGAIRDKMDTLSREGPSPPRHIWAKARKTVPTAGNEADN